MAKNIKITTKNIGFIHNLGMQGPIIEPLPVKFEKAINIMKEGHEVQVHTNSGAIVDFNDNFIEKMKKRNHSDIEAISKKAEKTAVEVPEEDEDNKPDEVDGEKEDSGSSKKSGIKVFKPSSNKK